LVRDARWNCRDEGVFTLDNVSGISVQINASFDMGDQEDKLSMFSAGLRAVVGITSQGAIGCREIFNLSSNG